MSSMWPIFSPSRLRTFPPTIVEEVIMGDRICMESSSLGLAAAKSTRKQRNRSDHQKRKKQNLRDPCSARRQTRESEHGRNQRKNEETKSPTQHVFKSFLCAHKN